MKKGLLKALVYAAVMFFVILTLCSLLFAAILLKADADSSAALYAGCAAVFVAALFSVLYLMKITDNRYAALIFCGIVFTVMICASLATGGKSNGPGFVPPVTCALAVITAFIIKQRSTGKPVKKRRRKTTR